MATKVAVFTRARSKELQELSVYGFIRRSLEVPDDLKQLCFSFYLILMDKWNEEISHSSLKINNDTGDLIARSYSDHRNAFGSFIIRKGDIQTWKIKITNDNPSDNVAVNRAVLFGIISFNKMKNHFIKV